MKGSRSLLEVQTYPVAEVLSRIERDPERMLFSMKPLYTDEVIELEHFLDVVLNPEKYGCRLDKGDPATYQDRAGDIIDTAAATIKSLRGRDVPNLLGGTKG